MPWALQHREIRANAIWKEVDRLLPHDVDRVCYEEHRHIYPLQPISLYSKWIICGPGSDRQPVCSFHGSGLDSSYARNSCFVPWLMAPNYMTWYMKISHPYLESLPPGDPPRPAELDTIIYEEAEADGQRTTTLITSMLDICQLIRALMANRDIPQDSHPYHALLQF
ncbi:IMP dehydrogenase/GMP reductase related, partial [Trifolium pratense]